MFKLQRRKIFKVTSRILAVLFLIVTGLTATVIVAGVTPPAIPTTPSGLEQFQSVYVPMKDGTKIAVRITLPPDLQRERIPAIVETTCYLTDIKHTFLLNIMLKVGGDIKANLGSGHVFMEEGYAFVRVEARGSGASFGKRDMVWSKAEIDDIGQVIDWVIDQPWSNGKVGTYGVSYSGNTAELAVALNHPKLFAAAPLYADFEPLDHNIMPGGIPNRFLIENWAEAQALHDANMEKGLFLDGTAPVDEDKDEQLLNQALQERDNADVAQAFKAITYFDDRLSDQYTAQSLAPFYSKDDIQKSGVPFYVRVGWLDAGTVNGAIERFLTYENSQYLVIGPWNHGGHQVYDPFLETNLPRASLEAQAEEVVAFFDGFLKEGEDAFSGKEIKYYTMGEGVWKTTRAWPVKGFATTPFYFYPDGSLKETMPEDTSGTNQYTIDFSATSGKNNRWRTNLGAPPVIYPDRSEEDQKLLTYTSEPLKNDLEITGNPIATLNLSSTATDGAFYVYLEAVSPDGEVIYITEGQLRALHRNETSRDLGRVILGPRHSYERVDGQEMVPGEKVELRIGMFATSVLIKKGYSLRIAIAGHDASNFERIPQDVTPTIELQTNGRFPSFVELPTKIR
ncbi:MAG: CocE/NonD family hydrolase [Thermoflexales bacterium]|nr:CocE/NonD family hydrolase [Thermoflexales bacterium]